MSDLQPKGMKITLGGKEYGLRFTLNVIDTIQDHYDISVSSLPELFKDERKQIANLRYLLTLLINEDIDCCNDESDTKQPHVDERYVGRHIDTGNMTGLFETVFKAFSGALPESDEDPNPTTNE